MVLTSWFGPTFISAQEGVLGSGLSLTHHPLWGRSRAYGKVERVAVTYFACYHPPKQSPCPLYKLMLRQPSCVATPVLLRYLWPFLWNFDGSSDWFLPLPSLYAVPCMHPMLGREQTFLVYTRLTFNGTSPLSLSDGHMQMMGCHQRYKSSHSRTALMIPYRAWDRWKMSWWFRIHNCLQLLQGYNTSGLFRPLYSHAHMHTQPHTQLNKNEMTFLKRVQEKALLRDILSIFMLK